MRNGYYPGHGLSREEFWFMIDQKRKAKDKRDKSKQLRKKKKEKEEQQLELFPKPKRKIDDLADKRDADHITLLELAKKADGRKE